MSMSREEMIDMFMAMTETLDPSEAFISLDNNGWKLDEAVNSHFAKLTQDNSNDHVKPQSSSNVNASVNNDIPQDIYDDEDIRDIIPQKMDTLVDGVGDYDQFLGRPTIPGYRRPKNSSASGSGTRNVFENFRDFKSEIQGGNNGNDGYTSKQKTLADLFRPPIDILSCGTFDHIKLMAEQRGFYILVNVQDSSEFDCQKLNRDTWSDKGLKTFIKDHFIFWQVNRDSPDGMYFSKLYPVDKYPHISILDGKTGRRLSSQEGFVDHLACYAFLSRFIKSQQQQQQDSESTTTVKKQKKFVSEDEEIEKAIALSLQATKNTTTTTSNNTKSQPTLDPKEQKHSNSEYSEVVEDDDDDQDENDEDDQDYEDDSDQDIGDDNFEKYEPAKPPTPPPEIDDKIGTVGNCIIQVRLADGTILKGNFEANDKLQKIYYFCKVKHGILNDFVLIQSFPKKELNNDYLDKTLEELELTPRGIVHLQERN